MKTLDERLEAKYPDAPPGTPHRLSLNDDASRKRDVESNAHYVLSNIFPNLDDAAREELIDAISALVRAHS